MAEQVEVLPFSSTKKRKQDIGTSGTSSLSSSYQFSGRPEIERKRLLLSQSSRKKRHSSIMRRAYRSSSKGKGPCHPSESSTLILVEVASHSSIFTKDKKKIDDDPNERGRKTQYQVLHGMSTKHRDNSEFTLSSLSPTYSRR